MGGLQERTEDRGCEQLASGQRMDFSQAVAGTRWTVGKIKREKRHRINKKRAENQAEHLHREKKIDNWEAGRKK